MPFDASAVRRWLDDIHDHIVLARTFADGMDYDAFRGDLRMIGTADGGAWRYR